MNQNDLVALGLGTLVVGGLAIFGRQLVKQQPVAPPGVLPGPPPGVLPGPLPAPPAPGTDPQLDAARQAIATLVAALQAQGGGTPAQREQAAQVLDTQAATLQASGQSPQAVALLRQASAQLRSGQLPVVPPSPNPAPAPAPFPFPFPFPVQASAPPAGGATPAATPSADVVRARAAIRAAERQATDAPANRQAIATQLATSRASYNDPAAVEEIRVAAARIASNAPATGQDANVPGVPSADLAARYTELRDHCADFLQGARTIDPATLGAADRTSTDLLVAGDRQRAADLGALATASYARAGIARPVATNVP